MVESDANPDMAPEAFEANCGTLIDKLMWVQRYEHQAVRALKAAIA